MDDVETFEIVTPVKGHKVMLKQWITGRESQKIDGAMVKGVQATQQGKRQQLVPRMSEDIIAAQENAALAVVVVSVDGKSNDVVNTVLNMRKADYQFVVDQVTKVVDGDLDQGKENSSEANTTESSPATAEKDESVTPDSE